MWKKIYLLIMITQQQWQQHLLHQTNIKANVTTSWTFMDLFCCSHRYVKVVGPSHSFLSPCQESLTWIQGCTGGQKRMWTHRKANYDLISIACHFFVILLWSICLLSKSVWATNTIYCLPYKPPAAKTCWAICIHKVKGQTHIDILDLRFNISDIEWHHTSYTFVWSAEGYEHETVSSV